MFKKVTAVMVTGLISLSLVACSNTSASRPEIDNTNLSTSESDAFTFTYPTNYTAQENPAVELYYANLELNSIGGQNNINLVVAKDAKLAKPNTEDCEEYLTELVAQIKPTFPEIESLSSEAFDYGDNFGCKVSVKIVQGELILLQDNQIYSKKGVDDAYSVTVSYEPVTAESEVKDLQDSLMSFIVK